MKHPFHFWAGFGVAVLLFLLGGCASVPDVIKGSSPTTPQNFAAIQANPAAFKDQEVRLGGRVVEVSNLPEGTRLEIASMALDDSARPLLGSPSQGRFVAYVAQFLDPVDYRGFYITVLGTVSGTQAGKIGETPYQFVVLKSKGLQRWHVTQELVYPFGPTIWSGQWRGRPYWNGFGIGGPEFSPPAQVITTLTE